MDDKDPRDKAREIKQDPQVPQDHDDKITPEKDADAESYQYTDWASI